MSINFFILMYYLSLFFFVFCLYLLLCFSFLNFSCLYISFFLCVFVFIFYLFLLFPFFLVVFYLFFCLFFYLSTFFYLGLKWLTAFFVTTNRLLLTNEAIFFIQKNCQYQKQERSSYLIDANKRNISLLGWKKKLEQNMFLTVRLFVIIQ